MQFADHRLYFPAAKPPVSGLGWRKRRSRRGMVILLTNAERLKFRLLAEGLSSTRSARRHLDDCRGKRKLTPADYASTTGLRLRLQDEVWVNAPVREHNPNF